MPTRRCERVTSLKAPAKIRVTAIAIRRIRLVFGDTIDFKLHASYYPSLPLTFIKPII